MTRTARIALNRPLRRLFDYLIPDDLELRSGQRVTVPFGRQSATGIVVDNNSEPPAGVTLKPVTGTLESWPVLPGETFQLLNWAASYYQHPLGECLFMALPPALRRGRPAEQKRESAWQVAGEPADLPANAHRQLALLDWLRSQPMARETSAIVKEGSPAPSSAHLPARD